MGTLLSTPRYSTSCGADIGSASANNNGHMALLECIFNALATTPPEPGTLIERAVSIMAANNSRTNSSLLSNRKSITQEEQESSTAKHNNQPRLQYTDTKVVVMVVLVVEVMRIMLSLCNLGWWWWWWRYKVERRWNDDKILVTII